MDILEVKNKKIIKCIYFIFVSIITFLIPFLLTRDYNFIFFMFFSSLFVFTLIFLVFLKYKKTIEYFFIIASIIYMLGVIKILISVFFINSLYDKNMVYQMIIFSSLLLAEKIAIGVKKMWVKTMIYLNENKKLKKIIIFILSFLMGLLLLLNFIKYSFH